MPKKDIVDFNVAMTMERLMRNGVDPNSLKNANQVENALNMIDNRPKVQEGITAAKSAKVFDLEGKEIDPRSKIMGGKQAETEAEIAERLSRENKESAKRFKDKMKDDPEDMAQGGRAGFKDGPDQPGRRKFMKIMGGLATLPILGKFFKGAKTAAPAAQKVMENFSSTASEAPGYFFDLVTKIKMFGKQSKVGPSERVNEFSYIGKNGDQYTLTEDIATGDAQIVKDKMGIGSYGDKTFDTINDRTVLEYKAPKKDVDPDTQRFIDEAAEYEEYRVEFDQDGTQAGADAIDEIIQKEIIEEATKEAPSIKKAGGGIARMLGE
jgi:hypothetical protein